MECMWVLGGRGEGAGTLWRPWASPAEGLMRASCSPHYGTAVLAGKSPSPGGEPELGRDPRAEGGSAGAGQSSGTCLEAGQQVAKGRPLLGFQSGP